MSIFSNFRQEELPVIGSFVKESFNRDIEDFSSFGGVFTADYLLGFQGSITIAVNVVG